MEEKEKSAEVEKLQGKLEELTKELGRQKILVEAYRKEAGKATLI